MVVDDGQFSDRRWMKWCLTTVKVVAVLMVVDGDQIGYHRWMERWLERLFEWWLAMIRAVVCSDRQRLPEWL